MARNQSSQNAEALFGKAMEAYENGDLSAARKKIRRLQQSLPDEPAVWQLSAAIAIAQGKPAIAADFCRKGLARAGGSPALRDLFGTALSESGRPEEAAAEYRKSLELDPGNPGTLNNLGHALMALRRFDEAVDVYRESLHHRAGHVDTLAGLAVAHDMAGDAVAAAAAYRHVIDLAPDHGEAWYGLAGLLSKSQRLDEALDCYRKAVAIDPENGSAKNGAASVLLNLGRLDEAGDALDAALAQLPDDPKVKVNQSVLNFYRGDWQQGWCDYESRWRLPGFPPRPFRQPQWAGQPLGGKTILVWQEQGLGDEIMFASMIPEVRAIGGTVLVECDARIEPLFSRSFPGIDCIARNDPPDPRLAEADFQIAAGNLGRWLRRCETEFPGGEAFLRADAERTAELRARYAPERGDLLIGISWRSGGLEERRTKSMQLADLAPVLRVQGARFLSLQYGDCQAERLDFQNAEGLELIDDPTIDAMVDFDDHAAQVAACDLVVSISTTTVHLAGSLGVPAWVMLEALPDRRWLLGRADSPWYRSVSLNRQSERGNWSTVVAKIAEDLPKFIENASSTGLVAP